MNITLIQHLKKRLAEEKNKEIRLQEINRRIKAMNICLSRAIRNHLEKYPHLKDLDLHKAWLENEREADELLEKMDAPKGKKP